MNETNIRRARPEDLPSMQEVARRTIDLCYRTFLGDENVTWYIDSGESDRELEKYLDKTEVLEIDHRLAAFTIYFGDLIHLMMVDVDYHRTGLGTRLLAHSEAALFRNGNETIRLETFEGNDQAVSFYLKHGWVIVEKVEDEEHGFVRLSFEKNRLADLS